MSEVPLQALRVQRPGLVAELTTAGSLFVLHRTCPQTDKTRGALEGGLLTIDVAFAHQRCDARRLLTRDVKTDLQGCLAHKKPPSPLELS